jgi:hypothetical protein
MCPVCSSETFAYISRWVPAPERRVKPRAEPANDVEVYRQLLSGEPAQPTAMRWLKRGAFGFAALGAAAYAWKRTGRNESGKTEAAKSDRATNTDD